MSDLKVDEISLEVRRRLKLTEDERIFSIGESSLLRRRAFSKHEAYSTSRSGSDRRETISFDHPGLQARLHHWTNGMQTDIPVN